MYSDGQASQQETILRVYQTEGASADEILTASEKKTKPKSNEIAAFTKLRSLKQGDMPLSEFIQEARRLAELCNYPNDKDRLMRDTIVSGIRSLRAHQKCLDTKDLSLQDCITKMPSRGHHSHAGTKLQARVYQHNPEYTDYDSSQ